MDWTGWLVIAVGAGVLLNVTPCVLPAVPIKLRLLLHEGGRSPARRIATATALLAGSLAFFGGLGGLSVALQWSWGAPMGSPVFRGVLAVVLAAAAAALIFDVGRWPVPQRIANWRASGPLEGFAMGVSGGVLSLPCTGPFLGAVLAFSLTQPPSIVVALFAAVGFGMALPYLVLLAYPRLIPARGLNARAGVAVMRLLGLGLLAGALFYGREFLPVPLSELTLGWPVLAAALVWLALSWRARQPRVERALAGATTLTVLGLTLASVWLTSQPSRLDWNQLARANAGPADVQGPALVEFTADWCLNCKVLKRTVYREPAVARAAGDVVRAYSVDLTDFDDAAQRLLRAWGGTGLPYAVIIDANGEVERRLRDLFTADTLARALRSARASTSAGRTERRADVASVSNPMGIPDAED